MGLYPVENHLKINLNVYNKYTILNAIPFLRSIIYFLSSLCIIIISAIITPKNRREILKLLS